MDNSHRSFCQGRGIAEWVICRVCFQVIPAPYSSAEADPSPLLSAKRPTGRNQPKLPLLIQRDRWIPSRPLSLHTSISHPVFSSLHFPVCLQEVRKWECEIETRMFYVRGTVLSPRMTLSVAAVIYCLHSGCCDWTCLPVAHLSPLVTELTVMVRGCFSASNPPMSFCPSIQITVATEKILH